MKLVCVGVGSMGHAIIDGVLQKQVFTKEQIHLVVRREEQAKALQEELGLVATTTLPTLTAEDVLLLAIKPQVLVPYLEGLKVVPTGMAVISIAAGITLASLEAMLPMAHWYRAMPNMPIVVGAGLTALTVGHHEASQLSLVSSIFDALGETIVGTELDLDRLGALSGTGPGYVYTILDAMANAGVELGLSRAVAIKAAAQTLYGSGLVAVQSGLHPAVLRDQVTSPAGTTIAGIHAMEKAGVRTAIADAVRASYERSIELGSVKK